MLTVREAAAHADVGETMIRQWVKDGTLPHFRVGAKGKRGKILIAAGDLDAVMAGFKVERPGPVKAPAPKPVTPCYRHVRLS